LKSNYKDIWTTVSSSSHSVQILRGHNSLGQG